MKRTDPAVTKVSVLRAKLAQALERAEFTRETGIKLDAEGRPVFSDERQA